MEDVITLVNIGEETEDEYGIPQESSFVFQDVLCDVRSASRAEFYQAAQAGLHPELEVLLFFGDYSGEPMVIHHGTVYDVLRTYRTHRDFETQMSASDSDRVSLSLEKHIGVLPGLLDAFENWRE